jgi:hypothetical protein
MYTWWNAWKLRTFLIGGLLLIIVDNVSKGGLNLGVLRGLDVYLIVSSFYFALDPQARIEKRRQEVLVFLLFPGAFVASLIPLYALLLWIATYMAMV